MDSQDGSFGAGAMVVVIAIAIFVIGFLLGGSMDTASRIKDCKRFNATYLLGVRYECKRAE